MRVLKVELALQAFSVLFRGVEVHTQRISLKNWNWLFSVREGNVVGDVEDIFYVFVHMSVCLSIYVKLFTKPLLTVRPLCFSNTRKLLTGNS